ncbi:helix-turn-helix domain-containing protein [Knoellia sp. DB2414S]|uniref:Helix-turn-helix domain-containing protein n=1 Tax=Knoellia koreensis TaxID=2730921 RepID=A0A849HM08_9MICO|nr:helix-turn-helix domain-containing protein [Knoellia sp. DB2414S]
MKGVMEEQSSRRRVPGPAPMSRQREEYARLVARGVSNAEACRIVGVNRRTGTRWRYGHTVPDRDGSVRQYPAMVTVTLEGPARSARYLSEQERGVIADRRRAGESMRSIARELGRDVSTVSRELGRNGDEQGRYRPSAAHRLASARLARPRYRQIAVDRSLAHPPRDSGRFTHRYGTASPPMSAHLWAHQPRCEQAWHPVERQRAPSGPPCTPARSCPRLPCPNGSKVSGGAVLGSCRKVQTHSRLSRLDAVERLSDPVQPIERCESVVVEVHSAQSRFRRDCDLLGQVPGVSAVRRHRP